MTGEVWMHGESLKPNEKNFKSILESHGEILDSWYESRDHVEQEIDELKGRIKDLRLKLKKIDAERKFQPPIMSKSSVSGTEVIVTRYQIIDIDKGLIVAEEKKDVDI
jgi:hypothetical protein